MKTFKRILLGMDLSNTDLQLLEYVKMLAEIQQPEKVYCTHVVKKLDLPSYVSKDLNEFQVRPLDERLKKSMQHEIGLKLDPNRFSYETDVLEGNIANQLLHWAEVKGCDLTLLGRKIPAKGSGISARRFLRKTNASVLFVPHREEQKLERIVVAIDYSKYSTYSLINVVEWAKKLKHPVEIVVLHVFDNPAGTGSAWGHISEKIAKNIKKSNERFVEEYLDELDLPKEQLSIKLVENPHMNPGNLIYQEAKNLEADLLVMGAQGHTALGNFILGSVSERVLDQNLDIPFLIMRPTDFELSNMKSFSIRHFNTIEYA